MDGAEIINNCKDYTLSKKISTSTQTLLEFGKHIDFKKCLAIHIARAELKSFESSADSIVESMNLIRITVKNFGIFLITGFRIRHPRISDHSCSHLLIESFTDSYLTGRTTLLTSALTGLSKLTIYSDRVFKTSAYAIFMTLRLMIANRRQIHSALYIDNLKRKKLNYLYLLAILAVGLSDAIKIFGDLQRFRAVIAAQEMLTSENLICQLANHIGLETYALVHGLGQIDHDENSPSRSGLSSYVFKAFYSSTVCKTICCWGEYHAAIYKLSGARKVYAVGMPGYLEMPSLIEEGVTFIFDSDERENLKLLKLESEIRAFGIKTSLWAKPGTKLFRELGGARVGPARSYAVGLKSTLLAELGTLKFKVYLIRSRFFPSSVFNEVFINDADDLLKKIFSVAPYPFDVWKYLIISCGEDAANALSTAVKPDVAVDF
jgi:hypothetical protein